MTVVDALLADGASNLISVEPWYGDEGGGLKLSTDHYTVYTTVTKPALLERLAAFVEDAHAEYVRYVGYDVAPKTRSRIYLFAHRSQWETFTRSFAGDQACLFLKIQEGAYCLNGYCVAYDIGDEKTIAAIGHEGWHQFTSRHFKYRLPSWLDEGIAMQFETVLWHLGRAHFDSAQNYYRLASLRRTIHSEFPMSLSDLLRSSPGQVMASDRTKTVSVFYSQSYALVRFLQEAAGPQMREAFHQMIQDGLHGHWPLSEDDLSIAENRNLPRTLEWNSRVGRQLFEDYICPDPESLEKPYLDFCRSLTLD